MKYPTLKAFQQLMLSADSTDDATRNCTSLDKNLANFARQNGRIRGNIRKRRAGVASWGWKLTPTDPNRAEEAQLATHRLARAINAVIAAACEYTLYSRFAIRLNWVDSLDESGSNVVERVPIPVRLRPWATDTREDGQIQLMPERKVIAPDDVNYIWACDEPDARSGDMLSIGEAEIMRRDMMMEWANYNRKLKGIIQGIDKGTDAEERAISEQAMQTAISHNYIITSDLMEFKFAQLVASGGGDSFKSLADELRTGITVAILGEANTTELVQNGGSRAAVQIQAQIGADIMWTDIGLINEVVNSQLLVHDYVVNAQQRNPPYTFAMDIQEPKDYESNVVVLREALAAGLKLKESEAYANIGYSVPTAGDAVITQSQLGGGL